MYQSVNGILSKHDLHQPISTQQVFQISAELGCSPALEFEHVGISAVKKNEQPPPYGGLLPLKDGLYSLILHLQLV